MFRIDPFVTGLLLIAGSLAAFVMLIHKQDPADLSKETASRARTRPRAKGLPKGWSSREKYNAYIEELHEPSSGRHQNSRSLRITPMGVRAVFLAAVADELANSGQAWFIERRARFRGAFSTRPSWARANTCALRGPAFSTPSGRRRS